MKPRINPAGEIEIWHCSWHENAANLRIRAEIEALCEEHHTKLVNSGLCEDCAEKYFPIPNITSNETED